MPSPPIIDVAQMASQPVVYAPYPGAMDAEMWPMDMHQMTKQLLNARRSSGNGMGGSAHSPYDNVAEAAAGAAALISRTHSEPVISKIGPITNNQQWEMRATRRAPPPPLQLVNKRASTMPITQVPQQQQQHQVQQQQQQVQQQQQQQQQPQPQHVAPQPKMFMPFQQTPRTPPIRLPTASPDLFMPFPLPSVVLHPPDDEPGDPVSLYPRGSPSPRTSPNSDVFAFASAPKPPVRSETAPAIVQQPKPAPAPKSKAFTMPTPPFGRRYSALVGGVVLPNKRASTQEPAPAPPVAEAVTPAERGVRTASRFEEEFNNLMDDLPAPGANQAAKDDVIAQKQAVQRPGSERAQAVPETRQVVSAHASKSQVKAEASSSSSVAQQPQNRAVQQPAPMRMPQPIIKQRSMEQSPSRPPVTQQSQPLPPATAAASPNQPATPKKQARKSFLPSPRKSSMPVNQTPKEPETVPSVKAGRRRTMSLSALFTRKKKGSADDMPPMPQRPVVHNTPPTPPSDKSSKRKTLLNKGSLKDLFSSANSQSGPPTPAKQVRKTQSKPNMRAAPPMPPMPAMPPMPRNQAAPADVANKRQTARPTVVPDALAALTGRKEGAVEVMDDQQVPSPDRQVVPDALAALTGKSPRPANSDESPVEFVPDVVAAFAQTGFNTRMSALERSLASPTAIVSSSSSSSASPAPAAPAHEAAPVPASVPAPVSAPVREPATRPQPEKPREVSSSTSDKEPNRRRAKTLSKRLSLGNLVKRWREPNDAPDVPSVPTQLNKETSAPILPMPDTRAAAATPPSAIMAKEQERRQTREMPYGVEPPPYTGARPPMPPMPASEASSSAPRPNRTSRVPPPQFDPTPAQSRSASAPIKSVTPAVASPPMSPPMGTDTLFSEEPFASWSQKKTPDYGSIGRRSGAMPPALAATIARRKPVPSAQESPVANPPVAVAPTEPQPSTTQPIAPIVKQPLAPIDTTVTLPSPVAAAATLASPTPSSTGNMTPPESPSPAVSYSSHAEVQTARRSTIVSLNEAPIVGRVNAMSPTLGAVGSDESHESLSDSVTLPASRKVSLTLVRSAEVEEAHVAAEPVVIAAEPVETAAPVAGSAVTGPVAADPVVAEGAEPIVQPQSPPIPSTWTTFDSAAEEAAPVVPKMVGLGLETGSKLEPTATITATPPAPTVEAQRATENKRPSPSARQSTIPNVDLVALSPVESRSTVKPTGITGFVSIMASSVASAVTNALYVEEVVEVDGPREESAETTPTAAVFDAAITTSPQSEHNVLDSPFATESTASFFTAGSGSPQNSFSSPSYTPSEQPPAPTEDYFSSSAPRRAAVPAALAASAARRRTSSQPVTSWCSVSSGASSAETARPPSPQQANAEPRLAGQPRSVSMPTNNAAEPYAYSGGMTPLCEMTESRPDSPLDLQMPGGGGFVVPLPAYMDADNQANAHRSPTVGNYVSTTGIRGRARRDSEITNAVGSLGFASRGQVIEQEKSVSHARAAPVRYEPVARRSLNTVVDYSSARCSRASQGTDLAMWTESTVESLTDDSEHSRMTDGPETSEPDESLESASLHSSSDDGSGAPCTPRTPDLETLASMAAASTATPMPPSPSSPSPAQYDSTSPAVSTPSKTASSKPAGPRLARAPFRALHHAQDTELEAQAHTVPA